MDIKLRLAAPEDAASLLEIYRPYVENSIVTLEYEVPSVDEFRRRICEYTQRFPYIVCEMGGKPVAYAYAHRYKERYGYRFSAELSVYADTGCRGIGLGKRLYGALIELLTEMGYMNIYGIITGENAASFEFHKFFGFHEVGREHRIGYKFGKWLDVVLFEKSLRERFDSDNTANWDICPRSIHELGAKCDEILRKYEA